MTFGEMGLTSGCTFTAIQVITFIKWQCSRGAVRQVNDPAPVITVYQVKMLSEIKTLSRILCLCTGSLHMCLYKAVVTAGPGAGRENGDDPLVVQRQTGFVHNTTQTRQGRHKIKGPQGIKQNARHKNVTKKS